MTLPGREGRDQRAAAGRFFAPFDKEQLIALSRLRFWNAVYSGAHSSPDFDASLFHVLGLGEKSLQRARWVFDPHDLGAWIRLLPVLGRIAGDRKAICHVLERFLGHGVAMKYEEAEERAVAPSRSFCLRGEATGGARGGQGQGVLGNSVLGAQSREYGSSLRLRIGPLSNLDVQRYRGLSFRPDTEGGFVVDLGPVCEFGRYWQEWGSSAEPHTPLSTHWPRLTYLLEHLTPANQSVRVHLVPRPAVSWRLGETVSLEEAVPSTDETSAIHTSTLGARTVLGGRAE
ncbi:type VI secretion system baseplate subunit TssG [Candidatus Eisenbacteria bacterium]|uniref:Type VI secretion system baseplate subunit TssG n=1 Tax=Eiseniibacteriota bacterium TaxID=2212470 RepID=A0ABV6YKU0_UNCEI